ncbi:DNA (cytosine-5)-methyltransferase DRM2-like [Daucus carota subsp. sativus]|uniref:DNA (cytosine-5)-methyltransferase DRM2-like n=1 Tax=Daucus carota subsp. sativus TaxID=79200 RepID=UPI003082EE65
MANPNNSSWPSKKILSEQNNKSTSGRSSHEIGIFNIVGKFTRSNWKASSMRSSLCDRLLVMGYPWKVVVRAIEEHGAYNEEAVFNTILTYKGMVILREMGFTCGEAFEAIGRCGVQSPITDAQHFIQGLNDVGLNIKCKRESIRRTPMTGFGVPHVVQKPNNVVITRDRERIPRNIPARGGGKGPPYFYFENVARAPKGVWETMSNFLYDIEPEFVDSIYFSAAARKRGYIHNLPIDKRFPILPTPPSTIFGALPSTKTSWPKWDPRIKLNCIVTNNGRPKHTKKISEELDNCGTEPPPHIRKKVLQVCRKYNFIWVGNNKVAPLHPKQIEKIMGFPDGHTDMLSRSARYRCLGNTFQVNTVGYHLSVLKRLFPEGIKVLSLFSGIGGAEVALHKLQIPLKFVVSVECSKACRDVMLRWWKRSNQQGKLIHISDVKYLTHQKLRELIDMCGGFDLVIGGSPCNNFAGNNRRTRVGFKGEQSSLFLDYWRILESVNFITLCRTYY